MPGIASAVATRSRCPRRTGPIP